MRNYTRHVRIRHALLQIIHGHVLQVDLLRTVNVRSISENTDRHARAGHIGQPAHVLASQMSRESTDQNPLDSARETLIALGVIVFQTNLKFNGLHKVAALLACRLCK